MPATYEDIEAEWERLAANFPPDFPPEARSTMTALMQHNSGLPVTARCIHCGDLMSVTDHGTAWTMTCPRGRSRDTMRGL